MPFPLIPTALGFCFLLMWALIAGMILRDGQIAIRRDRESDNQILPMLPKGGAAAISRREASVSIRRAVRAAS